MAPPKRPWFRFYVETFGDLELRLLPVAQRWVWAAILGLARMSPVAGVLLDKVGEPLTDQHVAEFAGVPIGAVRGGVKRFIALGMVRRDEVGALIVTKWDARQFESDDVASRVAKHRRSNADVTVNRPSDVTPDETGNLSVGLSPEEQRSNSSSSRELTSVAVTPVAQGATWIEIIDPNHPAAVKRATSAVLSEATRRAKDDGRPLTDAEQRELRPVVSEALAKGYEQETLAAAVASAAFRTRRGVMGEIGRLKQQRTEPRSVGDKSAAVGLAWAAGED